MAAHWVVQAAAELWREAGGAPPYPRDLEGVLERTLPLELRRLAGLSVGQVVRWVRQHGWLCDAGRGDQRLRGCLLAHQGMGLIFLESTDPSDEQRYTLAHEVAHFLADYLAVRREIVARLGRRVLEVLDGWRPPTQEERVEALLAQVPFGLYLHLSPRDALWTATSGTARLEARADQLALELLAPAAEVWRRLGGEREAGQVEAVLRREFGLPETVARAYAGRFVAPAGSSLLGHVRRRLGRD